MSSLMAQYELTERRRRRVAGLVVLAIVAGLGAWLTVPYGIVLILAGQWPGWMLVAVGAIALLGCAAAIVAAIRMRRPVAPQSRPGKPNPGFDEPVPSQDPVPGYSWGGSSFIGSP
ncbi:phage holin family protein [Leifsonia sp. F6_8S_P_1B]|uniref:Phage holin family protein n=1 Tax=Leifsonia williamsii TaxID=3035919 RepID=A0ABT8KGZ0_9MICO|nr:phage holin family protein [Leifsonia williamsii]MDN4615599.1 phage holin family protein [Leifsonia williamsii]